MGYRHHLYREDLAGPAMLYRIYDEQDRLLYVGVSWDVPRRIALHRGRSWGKDIDVVTEEPYETREEAFAAERAAIIAESPIHNAARPKVV